MITHLGARGSNKSKLETARHINWMYEKGYITLRQAIEMLDELLGSKKEEDIHESDSTESRDSDTDQ